MQSERSHTHGDDDARADWGILVLLVGESDQRPWSVEELVRERQDRRAALDSISRLQRTGLIHRTADDLVFPTRAALYYTEIKV